MLRVLTKKELENMKLFYSYINYLSCPTDYAIASGALDFLNNDNMLCSCYYVNDTSEMDYSRIVYLDQEGDFKDINKLDRFLCGIRPSLEYSKVKDNCDSLSVNRDISVMEYGYFPKTLIEKPKRYEDTGESIILPCTKNMFGNTEYKEFYVYKDKFGNYFVEYPVYGMITRIRDKYIHDGQKECFLIEPIRYWVDLNSDTAITQDVIIGGVPYKYYCDIPYEYDDYDESDVCRTLEIVESDIKTLNKLIEGDIKVKRK